MKRTLDQNSQFYLYLGLNEYDLERKRELILKCTGRTVHSHEMEFEEMASAIATLKAERSEYIGRHMKAIGLVCSKLGWIERDTDGYNIIDWKSLNGYIQTHYKKPGLHKLKNSDINKLLVSLKNIAWSKGIKV